MEIIKDPNFDPPELGCVLDLTGLPGSSSRIYDRSPYGHECIITGAVWKRLPSGLWYLDHDGTDDVATVTNAASLHPLVDDWSIRIWARIPPNADREGILDAFSTAGFYLDIQANGKLRGALQSSGSDYVYGDSSLVADDNIWHNFGLSWDFSAKTVKILMDGVDLTTGGGTGGTMGSIVNDANLSIGSRGAADFLNFGWSLLVIHRRLLAPTEFLYHYNQEKHLFGVW